MPEAYAPSLGAGLTLLILFGLSSTSAKIFGTLIATLVAGCLVLRFQYPCHSPSSLMQVVDRARALFDKCLTTHAFDEGEYDRYKASLQQIVADASGIASRTYHNPYRRRSRHHDYRKRCLFLWKRLKDIVECHCEIQLLMRDLEICLMRASHSRAEFEIQRIPRLTRSNSEVLRVADGHSVDMAADTLV
ncbi:hypothetical protein E1B28_000299 [Marasmius oreades]|uniref:Uncharacterized protein n=1 Tax=Marasmius oreades TaxID=181124 RepID=A0A9P8AEB4_9AGAR|nr:uncharacterized protein E1B28_000299 [Marasmius oreades]KAG7098338.1 hypothetical protein E1B28_000299 [Marasmius oreades]